MNNVLLFKEDLDSYSNPEINSMVRHLSLSYADPNDFRWLLAVHLSRKHGSMLGKDNYFEMMLFMDLPTLKNMCSTNKEMRAICKHPYFWKRYSAAHNLTQKPAFMEERLKMGQYQKMPTEILAMIMMSMDPITLSKYVKSHKEAAVIAGQESFKQEYTAKQKKELKETIKNFYNIKLIDAALYLRYKELADLFLVEYNGGYLNEEVMDKASWLVAINLIKKLLAAGVPPNQKTLDAAVKKGDMEFVKELLKKGVQPTESHLFSATDYDNIEMANFLLNLGVKPNNVHMRIAIQHNNMELAKIFLEKGFKPGHGHLRAAARDNNIELVKIFLDLGVQAYDSDLSDALNNNNVNLVKIFLERGVEPTYRNNRELAKMFLEKGVQSNKYDRQLATKRGTTQLIREIVHNYGSPYYRSPYDDDDDDELPL